MIVNDNKRRDIAVSTVRDRVVHRLLYDYLVPIWDKTFIYVAWSCRKNKGLHAAIDRAQLFIRKYPNSWLWRADITKLFDFVEKAQMKQLLRRRINDPKAIWLLDEVLDSYSSFEQGRGIPIGNLTSQIFANIYLNEFDRFISHELRPHAHLRYGDDWLCFTDNKAELAVMISRGREFLDMELGLSLNKKLNLIVPVDKGISYLGVDLWSNGRRIDNDAVIKMKCSITEVDRRYPLTLSAECAIMYLLFNKNKKMPETSQAPGTIEGLEYNPNKLHPRSLDPGSLELILPHVELVRSDGDTLDSQVTDEGSPGLDIVYFPEVGYSEFSSVDYRTDTDVEEDILAAL